MQHIPTELRSVLSAVRYGLYAVGFGLFIVLMQVSAGQADNKKAVVGENATVVHTGQQPLVSSHMQSQLTKSELTAVDNNQPATGEKTADTSPNIQQVAAKSKGDPRSDNAKEALRDKPRPHRTAR